MIHVQDYNFTVGLFDAFDQTGEPEEIGFFGDGIEFIDRQAISFASFPERGIFVTKIDNFVSPGGEPFGQAVDIDF